MDCLSSAAASNSYREVRELTERLVSPLEPEDCVVQSMPDASPTRWHLAHTTWFFETFLLARASASYRPVRPEFEYLFNSYYNHVGEQFPRSRRGLLSRPTMREVLAYRREVDARVSELLPHASEDQLRVLELGLHHEQQHQELILTDIKHVLSCNPLGPRYRGDMAHDVAAHEAHQSDSAAPQGDCWADGVAGLVEIGHADRGFCFDNELPVFRTYLQPHQLAQRLVTCGEYLEFVESGRYQRPDDWLSLGWAHAREHGWESPLYWRQTRQATAGWEQFTLDGWRPLDPAEPVSHVSYFEADAYARWRGARLPTEFEWEAFVAGRDCDQRDNLSEPRPGNFLESLSLQPLAPTRAQPGQWYGDVWEWTSSAYSPYPGYQPPAGALGEYNGKFMCNQYVLRGGSCATSNRHIRRTYRNFFPPDARWQFTGIRLAT
ncbi:MAG: ergothioneine biosynthesis protein EgtB [Planctomycetales bacterium]|nr:ergothioneine biosynthesis protein EgtB [Planctomycetales bacterium]